MKRENSDSNSQWWWIDSHHHHSSRRSLWLQSTLSELDSKTKAMLKLIEEDADSFAERAEMYYKKRPELIRMVQDFYMAHRSLAERYDQLKPDYGFRLVPTLGSSFSTTFRPCVTDQASESHSEACDHEDCPESEVDDPEQDYANQVDNESVEVEEPEQDGLNQVDEEIVETVGPAQDGLDQADEEMRKAETLSDVVKAREAETLSDVVKTREAETLRDIVNTKAEILSDALNTTEAEAFRDVGNSDEMAKLRCEIETLKGENKIQKDQLMEKDEEKREVIRQLSFAIEVLRVDNVNLSKRGSAKVAPKKQNHLEFGKLKDIFAQMLFNRAA